MGERLSAWLTAAAAAALGVSVGGCGGAPARDDPRSLDRDEGEVLFEVGGEEEVDAGPLDAGATDAGVPRAEPPIEEDPSAQERCCNDNPICGAVPCPQS